MDLFTLLFFIVIIVIVKVVVETIIDVLISFVKVIIPIIAFTILFFGYFTYLKIVNTEKEDNTSYEENFYIPNTDELPMDSLGYTMSYKSHFDS